MKFIDKELFMRLGAVLGSARKKIVIVPHLNPDGDAIGSAVGLGNILTNRGHKVVIIFPNHFPAYYNWVESKARILFYNKKKNTADEVLGAYDILFCVDFNCTKRVGKMEEPLKKFNGTKVLIDHHPGSEEFCDIIISDTTYSSTAELVFDVVEGIGYSEYIDQQAAACLYSGIMTDTGSFSHNISGANTFKVVSELLKYNINANDIHAKVYHNFSASRMKLLGYCLNEKMEVFPEYNSAIIAISSDELKRFNFKPGDSEGFVNYPLSISGIVFSALFIEKDDHVKLSFRSKGAFPANQFSAKHFNGGGHLNAAGGEANESLEQTIIKFKQLLPGYLHQLTNALNE